MSEAKQRPILFNGEMVRAILDGHKTMTRRPITNDLWLSCFCGEAGDNGMPWVEEPGTGWQGEIRPPHGKPGDLLYVREAFQRIDTLDGFGVIYRSDGTVLEIGCDEEYDAAPIDRLTVPHVRLDDNLFDGPWSPSIHMPKGLSRIWLRVADVRVERVQEITEEDARAEGIQDGGCLVCGKPEPCGCKVPSPDARDAFCHLWQATYPGSWDRNDWVWVYTFERTEAPNE